MNITDKILGIRAGGFVVMTRADFDARFPGFLNEPSLFVLFSEEWMEGELPDEGMTAYGDDPVLLEASFAEEYFEDVEFDEWLADQPVEVQLRVHDELEKALAEFVKGKRRAHLSVVK